MGLYGNYRMGIYRNKEYIIIIISSTSHHHQLTTPPSVPRLHVSLNHQCPVLYPTHSESAYCLRLKVT